MHSFVRFIIRVSAFITKEFFAIITQPRLLATLILGPFLILLLFGVSYRNTPRILKTAVIIPQGSVIEQPVREFIQNVHYTVTVTEIMQDLPTALQQLAAQQIDLVIVTPLNPYQQIENNHQATIEFYHEEIDPLEATYIQFVAGQLVNEINKQVLLAAVSQSKQQAQTYQAEIHDLNQNLHVSQSGNFAQGSQEGKALSNQEQVKNVANLPSAMWLLLRAISGQRIPFQLPVTGQNGSVPNASLNGQGESDNSSLPTNLDKGDKLLTKYLNTNPQVVVEPFTSETKNLTGINIQPVQFYIPAVLALLLQHIAISLAGLSIVRERYAGTMELMRAAPVNFFEVLFGKYVSFLLQLGLLSAALTALVIFAMDMPMLGDWSQFILANFLVIFVSLGLGFLISILAHSDS
jgi:ABC-2 type transport system permease protein